ncbi:DUF1700 domain-containing protein [Paenibacillus glycanilyticus]|uniref:HAAS signaling domain-containing protein n=1 Tax=Paenibacillus glycanilyticus TaxID=126569 RepID=UPI00203DA9F5|nr:DUF1700 domain-containing protein [Paenibacillus glycanilyticus]MCM3628527.1 DUF1700 domain-containing protein [Paenibacillus glycanilyticus]
MTKDKFLQQLEAELKRLSPVERADILLDYEEHFLFGLEEGKSEEAIAGALGSPSQIAKEILAGYHVKRASANLSAESVIRAAWAVIGLSFFNLVIVLGPALGVAGVILAGWAVSLTFLASPLLVVVEWLFYPDGFMLFDLFVSIGMCGIGILLGMVMLYVTKALKKALIGYLKYNVSLVKGGLRHDN